MNKRSRHRLSSAKGMTMAELLTVVAIIIILAAVGFIALMNYMRSMAQLERDGIAKQIFIAAQNHLYVARGEGYMDVSANIGEKYTAEDIFGEADKNDSGVRYFFVNQGDLIHNDNSTVLDLMLPFGSIDDTVRTGGSFLIRYQEKTGKVLDVFYCTVGDSAYDFPSKIGGYGDYANFIDVGKDDNASHDKRRKYNTGGKNAVLGWYGGDEAANLEMVTLKAPSIKVYNDETLRVVVTDGFGNAGKGGTLKLFLTGKNSGARKALKLRDTTDNSNRNIASSDQTEYTFILDDIRVPGRHFAELSQGNNGAGTGGEFIAGEDIIIQAVAYSTENFSNIIFSEEITENSLYESISDPDIDTRGAETSDTVLPKTAYISSIRHLENLEEDVSNAGRKKGDTIQHLSIVSANQTADIKWSNQYLDGEDASDQIFDNGAISDGGRTGFHPVSPDDLILYNGFRHTIEGITVSTVGNEVNAGLFGTMPSLDSGATYIKNLRLKNFKVAGVNAGALAGTLTNTNVINVIAYNSRSFAKTNNGYPGVTIDASGSGGGLIGSMTGGSVRYSGAAHVVSGASNAGGLIGTASGTLIRACYSGGHTDRGEYYKHKNNAEHERDGALYNVVATSGNAGGLVGDAGASKIEYSYSTCSAKSENGGTDGGLAGAVNGAEINNCYSTGLVSGEYAFIGSGAASGSGNLYYEIVNEAEEVGEYKDAIDTDTNTNTDNSFINPLDGSANSFSSFTGGLDDWNNGFSYDSTLETYYNKKYPLRTATQLKEGKADNAKIANSSSGLGAVFVNNHFGDWPAPEIFIINTN